MVYEAYEKQTDGSLKKVEKSLWNKKFKQEVEIWCENDGELFYNLCNNLGGTLVMDRCNLVEKEAKFGDLGYNVELKSWCNNNDLWVKVKYRIPKENDIFYKDGIPNIMILQDDDLTENVEYIAKNTIGVFESNIRDFFNLPKSAKFIPEGSDSAGISIPSGAYEVFSKFRVRLPPIKSERGKKAWEKRLEGGLNILGDIF